MTSWCSTARAHITTPTRTILNAHNGSGHAAVVLSTVFVSDETFHPAISQLKEHEVYVLNIV